MKNAPKPVDKSIIHYIKTVATILGLLGSGYCAGYVIATDRFDTEKNAQFEQINALKDSVDRIKTKIRADSIDKENWILNHNSKFSFNNSPKDDPTILVSNSNTGPASAGPANSLWSPWIKAKVGDLVSVEIYFHNTGGETAKHLGAILNADFKPSENAVIFTGNIGVGLITIAKGLATVFIPNNARLTYIKGSMRLYPNQTLKGHPINGESFLFTPSGLNLGDIAPGWEHQGVLTIDYRVEKT